jgi:hypothetical protein
VKFKIEKQEHNRAWTKWITPKMTNYKLKCCDCGLVHQINFRVAKVIKTYKDGTFIWKPLPKAEYRVAMKAKRITTPDK